MRGEGSVLLVVPPSRAPQSGASQSGTSQSGAPQSRGRQSGRDAGDAVPGPDPSSSAPIALLQPGANAPSRLLQAPSSGTSLGRLALNTVDYDDRGEIHFSGTAPPSASVRVYVDNRPVGESTTDAEGNWALSPQSSVAPGMHRFRVDQLAAAGHVQRRVELPFQRTSVPHETAAARIVVQPGENLWRIARHAYGAGMRYTVIYIANRDQIRDPSRIYPGQVFAAPGASP